MSRPRLTGNRCECPSCGLLFTGIREFDRHRVGAFVKLAGGGHSRRCLSPAELVVRGWRQNDRGFWLRVRLEGAPAQQKDGVPGCIARGVAGSPNKAASRARAPASVVRDALGEE